MAMHNLRAIKKQVIEKGFPELKTVRVDIRWDQVKDGVMQMGYYLMENKIIRPMEFIIYVDPCIRASTEQAIGAGIAHEGVHMIKHINLTIKGILEEERRYKSSRAYRERDEISTELEVINRGFGFNLLALEKFRETNFRHNGYIPSSHIEEILSRLIDLPAPFTYQEYKTYFL